MRSSFADDSWPPPAQDTVRDLEPTESVRTLMDKAQRGESVDSSRLVAELARMLEQVAKTDQDLDRLVLLVRPIGLHALDSYALRGRVLEVVFLADGSALVHTSFSMSARGFAAAQLGPLVLDEDLGGVPCFGASQLEVACTAISFEDALYVLGDGVEVL